MAMPGRGVPVRITQGITAQHSRSGFMRAFAQFGEVVYCRKPPFSGIDGEDYVNIGFASQSAADNAYEALKSGQVYVDGVPVGIGPGQKTGNKETVDPPPSKQIEDRGSHRRDTERASERPGGGPSRGSDGVIRGKFKQRHDERSPSPRTMARMGLLGKNKEKARSRSRKRSRSRRRR
mmetsp:Transcript_857/g.2488  ORF Transcript_857/g.2488 Transcript_857/m.2488 type:complete len:178 (-) Transcript_857:31-564(-)